MPPPLMTRWTPGPAADEHGEVVVSVTDFRPHHVRDVPSSMAAGLRLRMGWYAMRGAVEMRLWSLPLARRSGSISIWKSEEDLRAFVALPAHLEIMRRYRTRGTLRSVTWTTARHERGEILRRAREWIAG